MYSKLTSLFLKKREKESKWNQNKPQVHMLNYKKTDIRMLVLEEFSFEYSIRMIFRDAKNYKTLHNKALRHIFVYLLAVAGLTAEPSWLTYFERTHGYPGGWKRPKSRNSF